MRWEQLFADLAAQAEAAAAAELRGEVADRSRREAARLRLTDRLAPAVGTRLVVAVVAVGALHGELVSLGSDWLLLREGSGAQALVPLASVLGVNGLTRHSREPAQEGAVEARLGLGYALRALARDRAPVTVTRSDGSGVDGTIDRVGADFAELATHPAGEPRRADSVGGVSLVPFAAIAAVRSR